MKKTKLNIALADIMAQALSDEIDGSPNLHVRRDPQLQNLLKIDVPDPAAGWVAAKPSWVVVPDEIMAGLAERLRDSGRTATGRMREKWAPSLDHLAVQAANAGYAMQSALTFKDLEQLALKCHELKQRAPTIELSIHDFFKLSAELWPWFDIDRANAIAGDAEFYYNGAFFRLNPGLPAGRAKVIENEG